MLFIFFVNFSWFINKYLVTMLGWPWINKWCKVLYAFDAMLKHGSCDNIISFSTKSYSVTTVLAMCFIEVHFWIKKNKRKKDKTKLEHEVLRDPSDGESMDIDVDVELGDDGHVVLDIFEVFECE